MGEKDRFDIWVWRIFSILGLLLILVMAVACADMTYDMWMMSIGRWG